MKNCRRSLMFCLLVWLGWFCESTRAEAQTSSFVVNGVPLTLQEVTTNAAVYFRSMRLDRAANVWNVEVSITNTSNKKIGGPVVLLVDSFTGTSGMRQPDGVTSDTPGKAYFDLSSLMPGEGLQPGSGTTPKTLLMGVSTGSPRLVTRVFAARSTFPPLGMTRSLNGVGQPLPGVDVTIEGPGGSVTQKSDAQSGVLSFGSVPGSYKMRFASEDYLSVWRQITVAAEGVTQVPHPRLTRRSSESVELTPLGGITLSNRAGDVKVNLPAGLASESTTLRLTPLTGQSLPGLLPIGWSPVQSFWFESSKMLSSAVTAQAKPWAAVGSSDLSWLAYWDEASTSWIGLTAVSGNSSNVVNLPLPGPGVYAWVVGDTGSWAPPTPQAGTRLTGRDPSSIPVTGYSAVGSVNPASSPASTVAERVTGTADVVFTHTNLPIPSGTLFHGKVTELYSLKDSGPRITPEYDQFLVAYQRPDDTKPNTVTASFPMRPILLFGADLLQEARVRVEVDQATPFDGSVMDAEGGFAGAGPFRVVAGIGRLSRPSGVQLHSLSPAPFTPLIAPSIGTLVGAFDLAIDGSTLNGRLELQASGIASNQWFVLSRVVLREDVFGLEPIERLTSDARGILIRSEPTSGISLPGLLGSGQYVLVQVGRPQGLISGVARNGAGQVTAGMPVRIDGAPWLTLSKADGSYLLVAPVGPASVVATDLATGDSASQSVQVPPALTSVNANLSTVPVGPSVASITPAAGATKVALISSISITFSEPVNPATMVGNGIQLIGSNGVPVTASLSLDGRKVRATLTPATSLDAGTKYRVKLAPTITDTSGLALVGTNEFSFTTVPASRVGETIAELVIYQPGATNVPAAIIAQIPAYRPGSVPDAVVVHGSVGTADPEVPVILVNESSGETATVLSKVDGSFANVISGTDQDTISATFINLNGTRVYIATARQEFDDGTVGLYTQGGVLEAQGVGGPIRITVPANAIATRTKFKVESLPVNAVTNLVQGVMPLEGTIAGAGINLRVEGQLPTLPLKVRMPVNFAALGYPDGEAYTNAAAVLAAVKDTQDVSSYQVMDQMFFTPDPTLVFPPPGKIQLAGNGDQIASGFLDTSIGLVMPALGVAGQLAQIGFNQVLIPLIFGARPLTIKGKVAALPIEVSVALEQAGLLNQILNTQTGDESIDIPWQVAQMMGVPNKATGLIPGISQIQSLVGVGVQALQQQMLVVSRPLSGAFVTVSLQGGGLVNRPGRINPGMVYATSGADGYFLAVAPAVGAQYLMRATHPLYDEVKEEPVKPLSLLPGSAGDFGLSGAVFKNFFFAIPKLNETPPNVSVANVPILPGPGQFCELVINAALPNQAPKIGVLVQSIGKTNLLTGRLETNVNYSLSNVVKTTKGYNTKYTAQLMVDKPVVATMKITIQGETGDQGTTFTYPIQFAGPIPTIPNANIPRPDTNDVHGPLVIQADPLDDGFINEKGEMKIIFNKPIDAFVRDHLEGIVLTGPASGSVKPTVVLNSGQQLLTVRFAGLTPGSTYRLTLSSQSIRDLAEQPFDQIPSTPEADSYTTTFRTPPSATGTVPGVANGRGSAINGKYLYVLDQEAQASYLKVFDIENPLSPFWVGQVRLVGQPRDLVVIPQFGFKRNATSDVEVSDLVAVVGGDLDTLFNNKLGDVTQSKGQYLWVINMAKPAQPEVLVSTLVSLRVGSAATKVRWSPPVLAYQEFGADIQLIGTVNLQEMIFGFNTPKGRASSFPETGRPGVDLNGDGDYVDVGETLPIPQAHPIEFYGKQASYVLQNTTQKILDFSIASGGGIVGVTLKAGFTLDIDGKPLGASLPPMYRTLVSGGIPQFISEPIAGGVVFGRTAYPRWVSIFEALPILINEVPTTRSIALVSLTPDTNNVDTLVVLDISLPLAPKELNRITIPSDLLGGSMGQVTRRTDGIFEIAGAQNTLRLDPRYLAVTNVVAGQLHPSIIGSGKGGSGLTRSVGSSSYGVHAVAEGGRAETSLSAPEMRLVSFPNQTRLLDPIPLRLKSEDDLTSLLADLTPLNGLAPASITNALSGTSDLEPANVALHYYVLMIAPGNSGLDVELGLESLNPAGRPYANFGVDFAPVRAISEQAQVSIAQTPKTSCGAPIRSLPAYRLSDDPKSKYFNWYLSRPFALIAASANLSDLTRLQRIAGIDREILFSGAGLRAFIDPNEASNPVLGPFAAKIDQRRKVLNPVSTVQAFTINRSYLVGDNPPPPGEPTPLEDSYDAILSHSGEIRTTDVDFSLPSPRMPINIIRTLGTQDSYEGAFGVGWDFNYNQSLTVLDPVSFPSGLLLPIVVRNNEANSDIAGSQDVLFADGGGRVHQFIWKGTNMPPEFAQDPLVRDFNYGQLVSDYYLPKRGLFDLLVKFKDGRFERLTSGGMRYRYTSSGRLETIIDTYPKNRHELQYDKNGWLVRIDDRSVSGPRYVEFGYFRRAASDSEFRGDLDVNTGNPYLEGKICRLRDYAGRDVLFEYNNEGFLTTVLGIEVNGENGGYSGRSHTYYTYKDCRMVAVSAKANGTPVLATVNSGANTRKPVAKSTTGSAGNTEVDIPANNSASKVSSQRSTVKLGDGSSIQRTFDDLGHAASHTVSGPKGKQASQIVSNTVDGLVYYVKNPEGNTETRTYDSANPNFRSRANLLSRTINPGPRGGPTYTERFQYDPRYNLQSGDQVDANGFATTYSLTSDGRAVGTVSYPGVGTKTATYDSNGQVVQVKDQDGLEASYTYNGATGFLEVERTGTLETQNIFDGSVASQLGKPAANKPALSQATRYTYDRNLLPVRIERGALVSRMAYDELGRDIFLEEQVGDGKSKTTTKEYNDAGFITKVVTQGLEVDGVITSFTEEFKPDERSRVKEAIEPNGTRMVYEYDNRGNITQLKVGNYTENYEYDLNNNLVKLVQGGDEVRSISYDGLDRATSVINKTGTDSYTETKTFYPGGQLRTRSLLDTKFGTVQESSYEDLDSIGRHKRVSVKGGVISPAYNYTYGSLSSSTIGPRLTSTTRWDSAGNQIEYTDPIKTLSIQHDANGRVTKSSQQEQGANYEQTFEYDDLDHQISLSDLVGKTFSYVPRADGAYTKITNARGNTTTFDYTALGETIRHQRADGMETKMRYDTQRQTTYTGETSDGFKYTYDADLKMTGSTLRNGSEIKYEDFDTRKMPQKITFPGGSAILKYDLQRRLISRTMTYSGTTWEESTTYDGLNRTRVQTYTQNGGDKNSATFEYDPAGPLLSGEFAENKVTFKVSYGYYPDGTRKTVKYPSGLVVTEDRDETGRLTGLSDAKGSILKALSWKGNSHPKEVALGATMRALNEYDERGRITGSRVTGVDPATVLTHMRYQYDAANNLESKQHLHRSARADSFAFDAAERLNRAAMAAVPLTPSGSTPALYDRSYHYSPENRDYLVSVTTTNLLSDLPPFAASWSGHDGFLLPTVVDGFARGPADPKGNVARAQLWTRREGQTSAAPVPGTLKHDGFGRLVSVTLEDGVEIQNEFQSGGLRFSRKITQNGNVLSLTHYVYDSYGRLLEEYDRAGGQPVLVGRYIYASSDAPVAADLIDPGTGQLDRFYYIRDAAQSIIAIANKSGEVVERVSYDPFGQPSIEGQDLQPPQLREVRSSDDGKSLLLILSESVLPVTKDAGPGGGIVRLDPKSLVVDTNLVTVTGPNTNITGTVELVPSMPGYLPYSVVKFTGSRDLPLLPAPAELRWTAEATGQDVGGTLAKTLKGGAVVGPSLIGQGYILNGTTAYVEVPDAPAQNIGEADFTVAVWTKFANTSGQQVIVEKYTSAPAAGWSLLKLADNRLRLALGGSPVNIDSGPLTFTTTNWVQLAFRRQGTLFTLYTNGVQVASGTATANLDSTSSLKFGSREGTSSFFNGQIDELTLFQKALSTGELTLIAGGLVAPGNLTVTLSGGKLADEWGNVNGSASVSVAATNQPNTVYYHSLPERQTAAPALARSATGSPFLFQGQYFDYEAGLIYMRARYYDPYSGMFLEPDPLGYDSSVNHYAGLANNPVSARDPFGLAPGKSKLSGLQRTEFLLSKGYKSHEIHLINQSHHELSRLGMGDLEIAAHIRVMSKSLRENGVGYEISIRTFSNPEARKRQLDRGYQTKEEKVSNKTQADGLAVHENKDGTIEHFTGDLDGLYLLRNGQVATLRETQKFQKAVNEEVARLSSGWKDLARQGGQEIVVDVVQKAYQHGMSLNIPQEYGIRNNAMKKGGRVGFEVFDWIESKMKKGTGTAFAFSIGGEGNSVHINESVNVNKMLDFYENHYKEVMLNPQSPGFDRTMSNRRQRQFKLDGQRPGTLFPKTFRGHNYGEEGLN